MGCCCPSSKSEYEPIEDYPEAYHIATSPIRSDNTSSAKMADVPPMSAPQPKSKKFPDAMSKNRQNQKKAAPRGGVEGEASVIQPNKFNSTSTMYIDDTLTSPNVDELLKSVSARVQQHIVKGMAQPFDRNEEHFFEVFDERRFPIVQGVNLAVIPSLQEVYDFIFKIFETERLSHECGILCLAYVERIMQTSGIRILPNNWRRVVLSALILASKVWEDQAVWNVDFLSVFPSVKVQDLAQLEKKILSLLMFDVSLSAKDYARMYFDLREKSGGQFPLNPLDKDGQIRLEERTKRSDDWTKMTQGIKRSQSADWMPPKSPHAVLN